jgi:secreted trypsin-like serine protease
MRHLIIKISLTLCLAGLWLPAASFAIFNGTATGSSAPWLVNLDVPTDTVCTGTLISPTRVLTAAHCVLDDRNRVINGIKAGGGSDYLYNLKWQKLTKAQIIVHPGWKAGSKAWLNDLAILKLPKPFAYAPLSLGSTLSSVNDRIGQLYGWGATEKWASPDHALTTPAPVLSSSNCRNWLRKQKMEWKMSDTWLCAGDFAGNKASKAHTACYGDSGGPLVLGGKLAGVLSWFYSDGKHYNASECVQGPMYYLRLTPLLKTWIQKQL